MRRACIAFIIVILFCSISCTETAKSPKVIESPTWVDAGFLEMASVFVTTDSSCFGSEPWKKTPDPFGEKPMELISLNKGWKRLSSASLTALPSGKKVEIVLAGCGDHRWMRKEFPETKVADGRIVITIGIKRETGPHIKNYMPSLWEQRVSVENLTKGIYEVLLHSSPAGKISIP